MLDRFALSRILGLVMSVPEIATFFRELGAEENWNSEDEISGKMKFLTLSIRKVLF